MTTKSTSVGFRLKKGYSRVQVAVQELDHDVVVTEGEVFETDVPGVSEALDRQPALERVPATAKGGKD